jgi:DNA-binding MarR family transcriptional regulator
MSQDTLRQAIATARDAVDATVEQWQEERPDLDPSAKEITGRIIRLSGLFQQAYHDGFETLGLSDKDYAILAPLRRAGPPFALTPTELARQRMMTSGGMTAAIDRVERKGLVTRSPDPADRRGSLVQLTDGGRRLIDDAMARHVEIEHSLVAALDANERQELQSLLRRLVLATDRSGP